MPVRLASSADLSQIRRMVQNNHRTYLNCGLEDLPDLLKTAISVVGECEVDGQQATSTNLWGFLALQIKERADTLPRTAPDQVYLRAASLAPRHAANQYLPGLLASALDQLKSFGRPFQVIALTAWEWLTPSLETMGFREVDQIRFYRRTRRSLPTAPRVARLRPAVQADLDRLARLDGETFDPIWHMGRSDLLQLFFACRVQIAEMEGTPVGYTATAIQRDDDRPSDSTAQLVRIAVHPARQRRGIGRQLLADAIAYAHSQGIYSIHLNTQESNQGSQKLYEGFDFRRTGRNVPVLVYAMNDGDGGTRCA